MVWTGDGDWRAGRVSMRAQLLSLARSLSSLSTQRRPPPPPLLLRLRLRVSLPFAAPHGGLATPRSVVIVVRTAHAGAAGALLLHCAISSSVARLRKLSL